MSLASHGRHKSHSRATARDFHDSDSEDSSEGESVNSSSSSEDTSSDSSSGHSQDEKTSKRLESTSGKAPLKKSKKDKKDKRKKGSDSGNVQLHVSGAVVLTKDNNETKKRDTEEDTLVSRQLMAHENFSQKWKKDPNCSKLYPTYNSVPSVLSADTRIVDIDVVFDARFVPGNQGNRPYVSTIQGSTFQPIIRQAVALRVVKLYDDNITNHEKNKYKDIQETADKIFQQELNYSFIIAGGKVTSVTHSFPYEVVCSLDGCPNPTATSGGMVNGWIAPPMAKGKKFSIREMSPNDVQVAYSTCGYSIDEYNKMVDIGKDKASVPCDTALGRTLLSLSSKLGMKIGESNTNRNGKLDTFEIAKNQVELVLNEARKVRSQFASLSDLKMQFSRLKNEDWGNMTGVTNGYVPESYKNEQRFVTVEARLKLLIPSK